MLIQPEVGPRASSFAAATVACLLTDPRAARSFPAPSPESQKARRRRGPAAVTVADLSKRTRRVATVAAHSGCRRAALHDGAV